ncbi:MAG: portal protein [Candidatus Heimdallarchaeaceae archaeon]
MINKNDLQYIISTAKDEGYEFQERRRSDWRENYSLYRDKVTINRLTQRQSVNIPMMKGVIRTLLSKVNDMPVLEFDNLDNDKQKELFFNEVWQITSEENRLKLKDLVDKKQVMLYGRSFKKLNVVNGRFVVDIIDPHDMLVSRFMDPTDIDSSDYVIQQHIFSTFADVKENSMYDKKVVRELEDYFESEQGLIKSVENTESLREKNDRLRDMGLDDVDNPVLGQTVVELNEVFIKTWNEETEREEIIFAVTGEGLVLYAEWLNEVIGETVDDFWATHYPFESWTDDIENTDFWSDGVADTLRTPNKVVNSWFSQMVENRTLRNFGMNYYDSNQSGEDAPFVPQTYSPRPWGWYPVPGNPNDKIKNVEVPALHGNLEDLNFVIGMGEKASAATAIAQGVTEQRRITLGEVELLAGNANERIQSMSTYYIDSWKAFGHKYIKMVEAVGDELDSYKIFKKGFKGNIFKKEVEPSDWAAKEGYGVRVISATDKSQQDLEEIQKLNAAKQLMVGNSALDKLFKRRMLDTSGLSPDEIKEVMAVEEDRLKAIEQQQTIMPGMGQGAGPTAPPALPAPQTPVSA